MHKVYQINEEQSVTLDSAAGWLYVYDEYFGHDILPDLLPIMESILDAVANVVGVIEGTEIEDIVKALVNPEVIDNVFVDLSAVEMKTVLNIFWAMAKNEDPSIEPPEKFFNQFDVFPVVDIAPELFKQLLKSSMSSKNLESLKARIPFLQMIFSSGDLNAG